MQKSRWLFQTLVLSAALNGVLLCLFFYFLIKDIPIHFSYLPKEEIARAHPPIPSALLRRLHTFTFAQLVDLLHDERKVEQGYKVRDFALGALAAFQDFDVERGLGKGRLSKRKWEYEGEYFLLFPNLSDEDIETLKNFAYKEKYPLTPKGLFKKLAEVGWEQSDPELLTFFCHTPQFILLETLFARTNFPLQKKTLLKLALEGGWENLNALFQQQQACLQFSPTTRINYLLSAIKKGSRIGLPILLATDADAAAKELDDAQVMELLSAFSEKTPQAMHFVRTIAGSPRGDEVIEKATALLAQQATEIPPEVAGHFYEKPGIKDLRPVFRQKPPAAPAPTTHIVQPGESLWTISRKYGVPVEELMKVNHLQGSVIQAGKSLKISP